MIFVTLGTDEHPFERALDILEPLRSSHDVLIQHGHTPPRDWPRGRWAQFMDYDDVVTEIAKATGVVSHGGVGSIMTALSVGVSPIVIPRLSEFGEHVDNHQLQITTQLAKAGAICLCGTTLELIEALSAHRAVSSRHRDANQLAKVVAEAAGGV